MRMLTRLVLSAAAVALLGGAPLVAQTKAKAKNVPVIPHTLGAQLLQAAARSLLRRGHRHRHQLEGHVFVYHRSGDTRLFEFDQNGTFVREIGRASTASSSRTRCASTREDNIWAVDEGTNMVIKFNPEGRC